MKKISSKIIKFIVLLSITLITAIVIGAVILVTLLNSQETQQNENTKNINMNTNDSTYIISDSDNLNSDEDNDEDENEVQKNEEEKDSGEEQPSDNKQNQTPVSKNQTNNNSSEETSTSDQIVNTKEENTEPEEVEEEEEEEESFNASTSDLLNEANTLKSQNNSLIQSILQYTNEYRKEANNEEINDISNRSDLTLDSSLTTAACVRAIEIARGNQFSHTRPNGTSCFTVLTDMGINSSARAENIAECYSAQSAVQGWKNSAGHYKNMINPSFKKVGIGVIKYNGTYTWVQLFTN